MILQVTDRKGMTTILTTYNQFTFYSYEEGITLFSTVRFSKAMLADLRQSKIVEVEDYATANEFSLMTLIEKFGYERKKFEQALKFIIEKYEL